MVLRNYKSIATADVPLSRVSFLVGPNGSGKSNFLDALRFVAESLRSTMDHAIHERGGVNEVQRRSEGDPNDCGIRLDFRSKHFQGHYAFTVGAKKGGAYEISEEKCAISLLNGNPSLSYYHVQGGDVQKSTLQAPPRAHPRRLYLVATSGIKPFSQVYDAFVGMGFYNLVPEVIRSLQPPGPGTLLARDGGNAASVLANLAARSPMFKERIEDYLGRIVPGVVRVDRKVLSNRETLEFHQKVKGANAPWRFGATNMSDGTLRALGVLLALFQNGRSAVALEQPLVEIEEPELALHPALCDTAREASQHSQVLVSSHSADLGQPLVGIEEPELALHPAAAGVLLDALREASQHSQVLVSSHSADLLDNVDASKESVLAVLAEHGITRIGPLDEAGRSALRKGLFTAGELLRVDQLIPDPNSANLSPQAPSLFESGNMAG